MYTGAPSLGCEKKFTTTCPLIYGCLSPQIVISSIIMWWVRVSTKDELKAKITEALTNWNNETVGKAYRRFRSRLVPLVETNGDFFEEIQSIVFQDIFMYFW